MRPNPLIEQAFATPDGPLGCQVYWDGGNWVHRHVPMCPERYATELGFKEYRDIPGTKVSHVKLQLVDWVCVRERKYRLISKAIERLADEPIRPIVYLPMDTYFRECLARQDGIRTRRRRQDDDEMSW